MRLYEALARHDLAGALAEARTLDALTKECFHLAGHGASDLAPGRKDKDISTVERVRLVRNFLRGTVEPAIAAAAAAGCPPSDSSALNVPIEYQMGANAPARTVAAVLAAHFSDANVFFVGPAVKNKMWYPARPDLRHCHFVEKYSSLYTANKKHTEALYFDHLAPLFGHDVRVAPKLRKDLADSIIQVLGQEKFGDNEKASEKY